MAYIVSDDESDNVGNQIDEELADKPDESAPAPEAPKPEDKLGKFSGKTPEEIAAAYFELEKFSGKQADEVGELRKLTDSYIRSTLDKAKEPKDAPSKLEPEAEQDDTEFFTNPREAIKKALEDSADIREIRELRKQTQVERAQKAFRTKHPDADDVFKDPEFRAFVEKSPTRIALLVKAHNELDVDSADELFSTFKEIKSLRTPKQDAAESDQVVEAQKRAAGAATGTTGTPDSNTTVKKYSRRKIMELMINNPEEYAARNDEFLAAYASGRVVP